MHVSESSGIPDHCRIYALSDPKDSDYQSTCLHHHDDRCGQCSRLYLTIEEIEKAIQKTAIAPEVHDDLNVLTEKAKREVSAWKTHLLRSVNQDQARLDILQVLLLVQDWAMKFIPRKYRERQTDWFGKRGIPWHVPVAMRKESDGNCEMLTLCHVFSNPAVKIAVLFCL